MAVAAGMKEAKYTQGFHFRQNEAGRDQARQVVERSCNALSALLQEVFVRAEKNIFQQVSLDSFSSGRNRMLEQLSEILRARPLLERAMVNSVLCAFAALEDEASGKPDNRPVMEQTLAYFRERVCENLDLLTLLQVQDKVTYSDNRNRPLLIHLNGQLATVFGLTQHRLNNCPLGSATLLGGLVAGLLCVRADIAAKRFLLQVFEQEFLARLSVLLNSITLRLEEEGIVANHVLGFDEQDAGPITGILKYNRPLDKAVLNGQLEQLERLLADPGDFIALPQEAVDRLQVLLSHQAAGNLVDLFSELLLWQRQLGTVLQRADVCHRETAALIKTRKRITEQLNGLLQGRKLPPAVQEFLHYQWPEVLFDMAVWYGFDSEIWADAIHLVERLLQSVTPVTTEEQRTQLTKQVPLLVKALREWLEQAGCPLTETSAFFAQLKQLHLANVQQKLDAETLEVWRPLPADTAAPVEYVMASSTDRAFCQHVRALTG